MNNAEQTFFTRLRDALGRNSSTRAVREPLFDSREPGELDALLARTNRTRKERLDLLATLKEFAAILNLRIHTASSTDGAGKTIAEIARTTDTEWGGEKRITMHDNPLLHGLNLEGHCKQDGIAVDISAIDPDKDELTEKLRLRHQAEAAYMGITGADWCAADCGAIAVMAGPGRGRATSLVPSVHVAVLTLDQLVADLPELYAQLENRASLPVSFNFISGPSKTADIEAHMVHGAHGPREMHLIVITE
ncbi:LutC/YkgG family protein [Pseudodesulfovibrio sediminis]|uniref:LUD domain-containing protein n=1 Tax=Pseudodesulfovibrio sediminis TaxID=2810563 RepID=A0ABM7P818_9BACT|nr:lactate utilization protein [Pseudodesulfovibrio sediminis]BCS89131.1 hypothetical protein PSDVSF_23730 [Pseudodesulfovibrio sediminis]